MDASVQIFESYETKTQIGASCLLTGSLGLILMLSILLYEKCIRSKLKNKSLKTFLYEVNLLLTYLSITAVNYCFY